MYHQYASTGINLCTRARTGVDWHGIGAPDTGTTYRVCELKRSQGLLVDPYILYTRLLKHGICTLCRKRYIVRHSSINTASMLIPPTTTTLSYNNRTPFGTGVSGATSKIVHHLRQSKSVRHSCNTRHKLKY